MSRSFIPALLLVFFFFVPLPRSAGQRFYPALYEQCQRLAGEEGLIPGARRDTLRLIGDTLLHMIRERGQAEILFAGITDGSLTQLAQIWLYTALNYYKVGNVRVFSGGLRPEAINYRIVAALKRQGFTIMPMRGYAKNPVYFFNLGRNYPDYTIFAKAIDYHTNPHDGFLAVPVNPAADGIDYHEYGACCIIPCHWERPDIWDDTFVEAMKYDEYTRTVGRDMIYLAGYLHERIRAAKKAGKKRHKKRPATS